MLQIKELFSVESVELISRVVLLIYLIVLGLRDMRTKEISVKSLMIGSTCVVIYGVLFQRDKLILCVGGLAVGLVFVGISKVTGEALGYGDSWLLSLLGAYLGLWEFLELLLVVWVFVALTGMILMVKNHFRRKGTFPMVPFIVLGYIVTWSSTLIESGMGIT